MSFRLEYPLVSGRLLVDGNDFYLGNSSSQKVQIARVDQIPAVTQYVHPTTKQCNYTYTHPAEKQCSWTPDISEFGKIVTLFEQSFTNYSPYDMTNQPIATVDRDKNYPILYMYVHFVSSGSTSESENRFYLDAKISDTQSSSKTSIMDTLYGKVGDTIDISNTFQYTSTAQKSGSTLPKSIVNAYYSGNWGFPVYSNQFKLYLYSDFNSCQNLRLTGSIRIVGLDL